MRKCFYITVVTLIVCLNNFVFCQEQNLRFRHLTVDNGLSHTDATSIIQDSHGFIWIGTYSGLNRYDGYNTKVYYNNTDGTSSAYLNRISSLALGNNNNIWLATEGGLALFSLTNMKFQNIINSTTKQKINNKEPITKVFFADNKLFAFTNKSLTIFQVNSNNELLEIKVSTNQIVFPITDVTQDAFGNVYISQQNGLSIFNKTLQQKLVVIDKVTPQITALYHTNNQLYFSTLKGLFLFDSLFVKTLFQNNQNETLYNSNTSKLLFLYPQNFNVPSSIVKDRNNNFWLANTQSLCFLQNKSNKLEIIKSKELNKSSLSSNSTSSLFIDRTDCLWALTFGGGVNIADLNQKPFYLLQKDPTTINTISGNYIRAIIEDNQENIWIGTRNNGLNYYNFKTGTNTQFSTTNASLLSNNIRSLALDKTNLLWIGSDIGLSVKYPNGSIENIKINNTQTKLLAGNFFGLAVDKFNHI